MGLTGPNARASGVDWDLRVHEPYGAYRELGVESRAARTTATRTTAT